MSTVAPYKLPKQENTKAKHARKEDIIKVSSFSRKHVDRKLSRHNLDPLPY